MNKTKKTKKTNRKTQKKTANMCASCKGLSLDKIIKTDGKKVSTWLKNNNYILNFVKKTPLTLFRQKNTNYNISLKIPKTHHNAKILFFASKPSTSTLIQSSKKAYGDFSNYGVSSVNSNSTVNIYLNCPQCYHDDSGKKSQSETFYRHIHFCISNKENTKWLPTIYTKIAICNIDYNEFMKHKMNGCSILINALPSKMYAKSHIPNSFNLETKLIKKMNENDLHKWFEEVVKLNYPKLQKLLDKKKINLYELPIITYCAHKGCPASDHAADELLKKRFVNVLIFKGGMKEYLSHQS